MSVAVTPGSRGGLHPSKKRQGTSSPRRQRASHTPAQVQDGYAALPTVRRLMTLSASELAALCGPREVASRDIPLFLELLDAREGHWVDRYGSLRVKVERTVKEVPDTAVLKDLRGQDRVRRYRDLWKRANVKLTQLPDPLTREHLLPQQRSGGARTDSGLRYDLHNLAVVSLEANARRDCLPYGEVHRDHVEWTNGRSKLGWDGAGNKVFEPPEVEKGPFARALLYGALISGATLAPHEGATLARWASSAVTPEEWLRHDQACHAQVRRNILIDVDRPCFSARVARLVTEGAP